jgi:hypothetical protein
MPLWQISGHEHQVGAYNPAGLFPKSLTILIGSIYKDMALVDPDSLEAFQTVFDQGLSDALAAVVWPDGQVVHITAPPIVPAQNGADQLRIIPGDKTVAGVARQVG